MKKTNEPISFCQILTQNCYFWENSGNKKLKKKNKQKAIIDRKIGRPHKNNSLNVEDEIDDDRSYTKLFENVTFLITCQCEGLAYEHKGLPLGNRNSFQVTIIF